MLINSFSKNMCAFLISFSEICSGLIEHISNIAISTISLFFIFAMRIYFSNSLDSAQYLFKNNVIQAIAGYFPTLYSEQYYSSVINRFTILWQNKLDSLQQSLRIFHNDIGIWSGFEKPYNSNLNIFVQRKCFFDGFLKFITYRVLFNYFLFSDIYLCFI